MIRACLGAIALAAALSAPRPVRVRTTMRYSRSTSPVERRRRTERVQSGLYQDSLIAPFAPSDSLASPSRRTVWCKGASKWMVVAPECVSCFETCWRGQSRVPTRPSCSSASWTAFSPRMERDTRAFSPRTGCRRLLPARAADSVSLRNGRDRSHLITSNLDFRDDLEMSDAGTARCKWTTARA